MGGRFRSVTSKRTSSVFAMSKSWWLYVVTVVLPLSYKSYSDSYLFTRLTFYLDLFSSYWGGHGDIYWTRATFSFCSGLCVTLRITAAKRAAGWTRSKCPGTGINYSSPASMHIAWDVNDRRTGGRVYLTLIHIFLCWYIHKVGRQLYAWRFQVRSFHLS